MAARIGEALRRMSDSFSDLRISKLDPSVCAPDLSTTSLSPSMEEYAGRFEFELDFSRLSRICDAWFSKELNKVYCNRYLAFPVLMNVSLPPPSGSIIRAMTVFRYSKYAAEVARCCPVHEKLLRGINAAHPEHLIQVEYNEGAQYFSNSETKQCSVTVPFQESSKSTIVWYKYMCYTSCFADMNKRSILTIITLESPQGSIIGRRCFEVKICQKVELLSRRNKGPSIFGPEKKIHHLKLDGLVKESEKQGLPAPTKLNQAKRPSLTPVRIRTKASDVGQVPRILQFKHMLASYYLLDPGKGLPSPIKLYQALNSIGSLMPVSCECQVQGPLCLEPECPVQLDPGKERKSSSKQDLIPDPFAKEKCLCVKVKDCSEIQPTLVLDANRTLKTYRIHIPKAGTFLCSVTDLKFEVRAAVTIEYTYSSWSRYLSEFMKQDWVVASPVFDIHVDPAKVVAVHLPHFICLQGGNIDTSQMKIAHIVDAGIMLEKPSQISPFHVVWKNPTFSLLGVLIKPIYNKFFPIHSVVQLYKICKKTTTLHLYLIPNDASLIQAIKEEEEKYNSILVRKHPQTDEPLYFGTRYYISSSAELMVNPKELEFSYRSPGQLQSFMEIYLKNCRVKLSLKNKDNSVWDAWLEQEDFQILTDTRVKEQRILQRYNASGIQHQEKELHFIEVHREELIQRTANVEGIMDMLYRFHILDLEQYQKVLSKETNQEKMRELYQSVPSWNCFCKDRYYEALKMKNRFLIEDLEEKDRRAAVSF